MRMIPYHYLRSLELENRRSLDAGCWPVTKQRQEVGEGTPDEGTEWAAVSSFEDGDLPDTRRPPAETLWWNFYYRRLRSAEECARHMLLNPEGRPRPAFRLTTSWADRADGIIPAPDADDKLIGVSYAAQLIGVDPVRRVFKFSHNWSNWGQDGIGEMPFAYFDRYSFECWATYGKSEVLRDFQQTEVDSEIHFTWSAREEENHVIHAFEVREGKERRGWAFAIERDGAIEIEELYVRPEYRRRGHGQWLAQRLSGLAAQTNRPIRLWVPFADCKTENETNYPAILATVRNLGLKFQACTVPWAAYLATNDQVGSDYPEEPAIPERPTASWGKALVTTASLATAFSQPPRNGVHGVSHSTLGIQTRIDVGTAEWAELTRRRAELIYKKNRGGLTGNELAEFERLQQTSRETLERTYPRPRLDPADLAAVKAALGLQE